MTSDQTLFCWVVGFLALSAPAIDVTIRYGRGPEALDAWMRDLNLPRMFFWRGTMALGWLLVIAAAGCFPTL